jgi:hypothetical protein
VGEPLGPCGYLAFTCLQFCHRYGIAPLAGADVTPETPVATDAAAMSRTTSVRVIATPLSSFQPIFLGIANDGQPPRRSEGPGGEPRGRPPPGVALQLLQGSKTHCYEAQMTNACTVSKPSLATCQPTAVVPKAITPDASEIG